MLPPRARLHLFTLSSFAVAQPLYDLIGRHGEFLVAHRAGPGTIAAIIAVLSFAIPAILIAVVEAARLASPRLGRWIHRAIVGLLGALIAAIAVRALPPWIAITVAIVAAVATVLAYGFAAARTFLTVLSPAVLIFPLVFLLATPAGRLVVPRTSQHASTAIRHRPPIVIVVFDELDTYSLLDSAGSIDPVRFPNFAALARTATWFPNAVAAFPYTQYAIPAIVTGVAPDATDRRLPTAADFADNLFTWLAPCARAADRARGWMRGCSRPTSACSTCT
jgi:hypothetical protein